MKNFVIVILLLMVIGLSGYIVYDKNLLNLKEEKIKTEEKVIEEDQEIDLKNAYIKNDVSKKVSEILSNGLNDSKDDYIEFDSMSNNVILNITNINNNYKSQITLNSLKDKFNLIEKDYNGKTIDGSIDIKLVEEKYYDLFGEEMNDKQDISFCPTYYYNNKNNKYYISSQCGGTAYPIIFLYKNKFTQKGNNVYVYINIGTYVIGGKVYSTMAIKNYTNEIEIDESKFYKKIENLEKFEINDKNYKDFSEYKVTFKKGKDSIYHFESIDKLS